MELFCHRYNSTFLADFSTWHAPGKTPAFVLGMIGDLFQPSVFR